MGIYANAHDILRKSEGDGLQIHREYGLSIFDWYMEDGIAGGVLLVGEAAQPAVEVDFNHIGHCHILYPSLRFKAISPPP